MMVVNEDHYAIEVDYGAGSHTLTKQTVGTRYVFVALRTLVDPNDAKDFDRAHALQDATTVKQTGRPGAAMVVTGADFGL